MDADRFDQLARSLTDGATRRRVVAGALGAALITLTDLAENALGKNGHKRNRDGGTSRGKHPKNKKKTKNRKRNEQKGKDRKQDKRQVGQEQCIALDQRCRKHGEPCCGGAKCRTLLGLPLISGKCRCPQGTRECRGACIPESTCCADSECDAGEVCQDGVCGTPAPCDVCASGCPFVSVQAALDAASNGDTITICAGTYDETVTIARDLTLSGAGDGENPAANTILDGAGAGTVLTIATGAAVTLKTLRVTGGNADLGGGIYNDHGTLGLSGCTVSGNAATDGGGVLNQGGTLTLSNSTVSGNTASVSGNSGGFGGGIDNESGTLHLVDSTVSGNTARIGGGLFVDGSSTVTLSDSSVSDNTADQEGGGIATDDDVVTLTLTNCTVNGNTSGLGGGGIFSIGNLTLSNSTVRDNTANDGGGGIHGDGGGILNGTLGTLTLEASTVTNNHAAIDGGGIANAGTVSCSGDSTVSGNTAGTAGTENCFDVPDFGGSGCNTCPA